MLGSMDKSSLCFNRIQDGRWGKKSFFQDDYLGRILSSILWRPDCQLILKWAGWTQVGLVTTVYWGRAAMWSLKERWQRAVVTMVLTTSFPMASLLKTSRFHILKESMQPGCNSVSPKLSWAWVHWEHMKITVPGLHPQWLWFSCKSRKPCIWEALLMTAMHDGEAHYLL